MQYHRYPDDVTPHPRPCLCPECRVAITAYLRKLGMKTIVFTPHMPESPLKTLLNTELRKKGRS